MDVIEEERPMSAECLSAQSKTSKKSLSNLDAPFANSTYILRDNDFI